MKLFLLFLLIPNIYALNFIFYLTLVGKSHIDYVASLIEVLVERGHNVDYVIGELNSGVKWQGSSKARNVTSFGFDGESPWMKMSHLQDAFQENTAFDMIKFWGVQEKLCEIGLHSGKPVEFMKAGKYDAAIVSDYGFCGGLLATAAGIPTIMSYTATNIMYSEIQHIGLPSPASCVSENFDPYNGDFSVWGKIGRLIYLTKYIFYYRQTAMDRLTKTARKMYGESFPDLYSITRNYDLVFINSNEIIETPRTISHKVKYIGGIGLKHPKPLDQEFEKILSIPSKGVIIFSFGTQVPSGKVNERVKNILAESFRVFSEYTFIWKHELQEGDNVTFNGLPHVHFMKWFPQKDLLYDPRVRVFITHAGLNSFLESAAAGVPVVAIPLFADQMFNSRSIVRLGMGVQLDKVTFTSTDLINALNKVLQKKSHFDEAKKISKMMAKKPEQAKQTFAEWAEFAAENPGLHKMLNLQEADLNPLVYYCVDVVAIVFAGVCLFTWISYKLLCRSRSQIKI